MSSTVFANQSHHKQILDFIKRILIERKDYEPLSDIFRARPIKGETLREKNFFKVDFIHLFTTKRGNLLYSDERQAIFYKDFLDFVRLRQRMGHNQRYLYRIFPQGEKGEETFSVEALRMLDRLTWHILHEFEEDIAKKTEHLKKNPKILEKMKRGEILLVLNAEGLKALRAGIPVSEIIDNGLVTVVDESGVLPPDIGKDENGGIFPIMKLFDEDGDLSKSNGFSWDKAAQYFPMEKMAVLFGIFENHGLLIENIEISQNEIRGTYVENGEAYTFSLNAATDVITIISANNERKEAPLAVFLDEMEQYEAKGAAEEILAKMGIQPSIPEIIDMKLEGENQKIPLAEIPLSQEKRAFRSIGESPMQETFKPVAFHEPQGSVSGQGEGTDEISEETPEETSEDTSQEKIPQGATARESTTERANGKPNMQGADGQPRHDPREKSAEKRPAKKGTSFLEYVEKSIFWGSLLTAGADISGLV